MNITLHKDARVTLNNETSMPRIGLGVWKAEDGEEVKEAVSDALEAGYRLIDTARIYGNERGVGAALAETSIPREEISVTTKLWNDDQGHVGTHNALRASLERLGLSYVDLYLIHWPNEHADIRKETWHAMEDMYASGKTKAIGVSNYSIALLEEMKTYTDLLPAVNQVEFHPFLYQSELLAYCNDNGIVLEAYSPLARGVKLSDPKISEIAQQYGKSNAQVLIRWSLQQGCVVIPKSVHKERIEENIDVFDFELSSETMEALNSLNAQQSFL